ncbi:MAG: 50S ribosomal protein L11 methyltransferase, partial [Ferruginibacter sp.]
MLDKTFVELHFASVDKINADMLIALLSDAGYTGFEEQENELTAFIDEIYFNEQEMNNIFKIIPVNYTKSIIKQQNWNAQWESSFEPIIVNDFVGIRAAFHQPIKNVKHEIIITPKMSFGTGHHATTYMMIEQMESLDLTNKRVVDFGTGTAVLAILAEKMGAISVDAIDYDEWSIENSIENTAANFCYKINLVKADTIADNGAYDIILANINLNVIMENLAPIKNASKKGTVILLSGFIKTDEAMMIRSLKEYGIGHL